MLDSPLHIVIGQGQIEVVAHRNVGNDDDGSRQLNKVKHGCARLVCTGDFVSTCDLVVVGFCPSWIVVSPETRTGGKKKNLCNSAQFSPINQAFVHSID